MFERIDSFTAEIDAIPTGAFTTERVDSGLKLDSRLDQRVGICLFGCVLEKMRSFKKLGTREQKKLNRTLPLMSEPTAVEMPEMPVVFEPESGPEFLAFSRD